MNFDFEKLIELSKKPDIFTPGDSFLWTDPHIARQMLKTHLDPNTDSASRKPETIDDTVEFCIRRLGLKAGNTVLDAGCGPGLYCERFVKKGLKVSGLDISSNSISYARSNASENDLNIKYICGNYLDMDFANEFDAVFMIWWDFCVLVPADRIKVLKNIRNALKPGGHFVFDVSTPLIDGGQKESSRWYSQESGFFSGKPHMVLENKFYYPEHLASLTQYVVLDESGTRTFRLYHTSYTPETIKKVLGEVGFKADDLYQDLTGTPYSSVSRGMGVFASVL